MSKLLTRIAGEEFTVDDLYKLSPEKLEELVRSISPKQLEDICDLGMRHSTKPQEERLVAFVKHITTLMRPFAFATQDDSLNECEKLFCIFYRRFINMQNFIRDTNLKQGYTEYIARDVDSL